ncbi:LysR family transcriptional regulator [Advenella sp. S44]|uniref:LysR family transcriptional regulator n=1 Tax=Advenella sp. S44 TaxID=1982755 RepID=UPI000C299ACB|nr:LysR family transcriptional regulator [Advenella sp. S44]PJX25241.1 LysR family transcriptional regulator [Advenella sp. S44]
MAINANDLILFAQVMDSGSFSAAAERLDLPKSTLSRRISGLETELGERLITRSTRKLMITEFGSEVLEHAKRLVDETECTMAFARNRQATPQGTLRVSFPPDFFEHALAEFLPLFSEKHPNVRLELDLSARRVDLLTERFDAAIRVASSLPDDNTLVARRLATLVTSLHASPSYMQKYGAPTEPADLKTHRGLMLMNSMGEIRRWRLSRGSDFWEGSPACMFSSNSLGLQRTMALNGMGIGGLPEPMARPFVQNGTLVPVLPGWNLPEAIVWCVTPGRRLLSPATRAFIEVFSQVMKGNAAYRIADINAVLAAQP